MALEEAEKARAATEKELTLAQDKGAAAEGEAKDLTEKLHAVRGEVEALTLASEKQTAEMHEAARAATAAAASATAHIESLQKQVADVDACADGACSGSI